MKAVAVIPRTPGSIHLRRYAEMMRLLTGAKDANKIFVEVA